MSGVAKLRAPETTRDAARARYREVRFETVSLCEPLAIEDFVLQSMAEASPPKWHLAHTTWFFETFVLAQHLPGYRIYHPQWGYLFNSYYESVGERVERGARGLLSRPTIDEVQAYRRYVDDCVAELIDTADDATWARTWPRISLGLNHEQQHQELLLMDLKHHLWCNPLRPAYDATLERTARADRDPVAHRWIEFERGVFEIGHRGDGFAFDNESPTMTVHLPAFRLGNRLVTNGEFLEFIEAGCYRDPSVWLADGWALVQETGWQAPLYWEQIDGAWHQFTLGGMRPLDERDPVVHVSYYEANAFAYWKRLRLPTEFEWERAARALPIDGNFLESRRLQPTAAARADGLQQVYGDVWELTQSPYAPYPGFRPLEGGLGEYNGKFMVSQLVQRGGSCFTPRSHIRPTYRNFFYPNQRWNTQGFRLAADIP